LIIILKEEFFVIEVKNVTKKYGKFIAVDNISFTINEGEVVGLLGPNGAGKSTTMNMLTGFIEQTEGEIVIDGYNMLKKPKKAKREIGYMPEGVPLYTDLTVKEFVTYMAEIKNLDKKTRKEKVQKIIEQTGLKDVEKKLIRNLSRGYKQRVSMAGALVGEPKILILDEPTVGLDPKQITEIRNLIKELGKTHTVILSSHILSEVSQICNKVIIINKGKIVAIDTPEKLEEKVSNKNCIYITVEDTENKMKDIKEKIKEITKLELLQNNEDGTKQYMIESKEEIDLRKILFTELAKENITIFEMKKADSTLEDAFMKLIEGGNQ
jgi:ABC-2 type transport system ATP-binding protein